MAVIATFGDLRFETRVNDIFGLGLTSEYGYGQHNKLTTKPSLQQVGDGLRVIRMEFLFHRFLADPELSATQLRTLAESKEAYALVLGELYKGQWVIERIDETVEKVSIIEGETVIDILGFSVELLESAGISLRGQRQPPPNPFAYRR